MQEVHFPLNVPFSLLDGAGLVGSWGYSIFEKIIWRILLYFNQFYQFLLVQSFIVLWAKTTLWYRFSLKQRL